jgi:hypothetical protein
MKDNTTKLIATIIGTVVLSVGGTYTYTESQVGSIEAELASKTEQLASTTEALNDEKILKVVVGKEFVYSQITSGRVPVFTGTLSSEEISQAYIASFYDAGGDVKLLQDRIASGETINIREEIELLATKKGEMLQCNK